MNEEEKKDLKEFKDFIEYFYSRNINYNVVTDEEVWNFERIVKLVEKQQKEIEELKEQNKLFNRKNKKINHTEKKIKLYTTNKTGISGVCIDNRSIKRCGKIKYRAYITFQNKQINLGTYDTIDKAIKARKDGERYIENRIQELLKESEK